MIARMARRHAASRWLLLAGAALAGGALVAASRGAAADDARPLILLVVPDHGEERAAVTIAAHVRPLGVLLAVVHEPPASAAASIAARSRQLVAERGACGALWVGERDGVLSLFLYAGAGERLFERDVPAPRGQTSAAIEALALIAHSASAEMLEGHVATMTPVVAVTAPEPANVDKPQVAAPSPPPAAGPEPSGPAPSPSPAPDPLPAAPADDAPARRAESGTGALAAGYAGNSAGRSAQWQSALAMEAAWHPTPRATLGLGYELALAEATSTGPGAPQVHRHPMFAAGGYRVLSLPRWDVELGGRAVVDVVTSSDARAYMPAPTEVRTSLGPTADVGLRVLPPLRLGLRVGVDVMLDAPSAASGTSASDQLRFAGGLGLQLDLDKVGTTGQRAPKTTASR